MGRLALAFAGLLLTGAGCLPLDGSTCRDDDDCAGVCTNTGECAADANHVRIEWLIDGRRPSTADPTPCAEARIAEMSVQVSSSEPPDTLLFRPVPCETGQFTFDRLHPRYSTAAVAAHDDDGNLIARRERPFEDGDDVVVTIELFD